MGRSDIIIRMIELIKLNAPQGVEMATDKQSHWGGETVQSCEHLGGYKTINHYLYLYPFIRSLTGMPETAGHM